MRGRTDRKVVKGWVTKGSVPFWTFEKNLTPRDARIHTNDDAHTADMTVINLPRKPLIFSGNDFTGIWHPPTPRYHVRCVYFGDFYEASLRGSRALRGFRNDLRKFAEKKAWPSNSQTSIPVRSTTNMCVYCDLQTESYGLVNFIGYPLLYILFCF